VTGKIVAFTSGEYKGWETWDWQAITDLGFWTAPSSEVRAKAKSSGVRLFQDAHLPDRKDWTDPDKRKAFAKEKVQQVQDKSLDGVFFDFEGTGLGRNEKDAYTKLAEEVSNALRPLNASIFVCVGASPSYEFRNYDYAGLAKVSDFLFIMGYDAHFWDDYTCVTKGTCSPAEAPLKDISKGTKAYAQMVPSNKLVLGLPWYGQRYTQVVVPFNQGQIDYADVLEKVVNVSGRVKSRKLDEDAESWVLHCNGACMEGKKGDIIWYDDAKTLAPKYKIAKDNELLGVGIWTVDKLPVASGNTDPYKQEREDMWSALSHWNTREDMWSALSHWNTLL
jgi:spore germination protein YaaH